MEERDVRRPLEIAAGILLVLLGGMFLLMQWTGFDVFGVAWPLFVIAPGLLMFGLMGWFGRDSGFLAVPASIVTVAGIVLFVTNLFDVWETWAYAWALVVPTGVGIGLLVWGAYAHDPGLRRAGRIVAIVGLSIFLAFAVFFELLLGVGVLSELGIGNVIVPVLLVLFGVWLMLSSVLRRR